MSIFIGVTISHAYHAPVESTATGCYYSGLFGVSALFWLPALVFEPVLCVLIMWKAWGEDLFATFRSNSIFRSARNRREGYLWSSTPALVKQMARESLVYFMVIFAEVLGSTVTWALANRYVNVVMPWSCTLPSIFGARLLLNMREMILNAAEKDSYILETLVCRPLEQPFVLLSLGGLELELEEYDAEG